MRKKGLGGRLIPNQKYSTLRFIFLIEDEKSNNTFNKFIEIRKLKLVKEL